MAKHYGGVSEDSDDRGKAAYKALLAGGSSGFSALLGGGRSDDGQYARLEAHGFYWTASESDPASGWFYNFGRGGQALHRQSGGEKQGAFSVRCVREEGVVPPLLKQTAGVLVQREIESLRSPVSEYNAIFRWATFAPFNGGGRRQGQQLRLQLVSKK